MRWHNAWQNWAAARFTVYTYETFDEHIGIYGYDTASFPSKLIGETFFKPPFITVPGVRYIEMQRRTLTSQRNIFISSLLQRRVLKVYIALLKVWNSHKITSCFCQDKEPSADSITRPLVRRYVSGKHDFTSVSKERFVCGIHRDTRTSELIAERGCKLWRRWRADFNLLSFCLHEWNITDCTLTFFL